MAAASNLNIFGGRNSTVVTLATRNVRIAKGAVPLYDRMMSDSKFITYGITFDVGKSVIKPEILRRGAPDFQLVSKTSNLVLNWVCLPSIVIRA